MSESDVQDLLMKLLFRRFGLKGSWSGSGKSASFRIQREGIEGRCDAEGSVTYDLPDGTTLEHKSDIQIEYRVAEEDSEEPHYICIEIKHGSAVTDQFKARAFDMHHMKEAFTSTLFGIMVFARVGQGIKLRRAKAITYPFDAFVGVDMLNGNIEERMKELCHKVSQQVGATLAAKAG